MRSTLTQLLDGPDSAELDETGWYRHIERCENELQQLSPAVPRVLCSQRKPAVLHMVLHIALRPEDKAEAKLPKSCALSCTLRWLLKILLLQMVRNFCVIQV